MANLKYNINLTIIKKASLGAFFLFFFAIQSNCQTFSKRLNYKVYSQCENVVNTDYGYLFSGNLGDTTDSGMFQLSLLYGGVDFNGDSLFSKHYESDQWRTGCYADNNVIIHDSILVTATDLIVFGNDTNYVCLVWSNLMGDTIQTRKYFSPYYYFSTDPQNNTEIMSPHYITASEDGNYLYLVCRVNSYPPLRDSFIVKKIASNGDEVWSYLPPLSDNYFNCDYVGIYNGNPWIVVPGFYGETNYTKIVELNDATGEVIQETELIPTGPVPQSASDMYMTANGVAIASKLLNADSDQIPAIVFMNYQGEEIWQNTPSSEYSTFQVNDHITQASDGGFVCCSVRYELTPATPALPTTNEYYRLWLWKVDANGQLLWERKYAYITLEEDTNFLIYNYPHDMKATPDGGFILAGEATVLCTNYPICSEFTQQGWLLKVDGCGCLVPGCDENCTTDVAEKSEDKTYIKIGPNPATDYIHVYLGSIAQHEALWLDLHSIDGKLIKRFALKNEDTTYMLDTTLLSSGNYIITLHDNVSVLQTEKVVVR